RYALNTAEHPYGDSPRETHPKWAGRGSLFAWVPDREGKSPKPGGAEGTNMTARRPHMTELQGTTSMWVAPPSLTAILGLLREGVVLLDRDRHIAYLNRAARDQLRLPDSVRAGAGPFTAPAASDTVELDLDGEPCTAVIMRDLAD